MAADLLIPQNVLVINPRPKKPTRFILECKTFDATTKIAVADPGIISPCAFDVISVVVLDKGPPTRLLVTIRFRKLLPGPIGASRPLTVKATTGLVGATSEVALAVTGYFHSRNAASVGSNKPVKQKLNLVSVNEQFVDIPFAELGGVTSATVTSTQGTFKVSRLVYDGTNLKVVLSPTATAAAAPGGVGTTAAGVGGLSVTLDCDDDTTPMDPIPVEIDFV